MNFIENISTIIAIFVGVPILVYLCVRFGTTAYYKTKQYVNKENKN